jgi:hypothetical protein
MQVALIIGCLNAFQSEKCIWIGRVVGQTVLLGENKKIDVTGPEVNGFILSIQKKSVKKNGNYHYGRNRVVKDTILYYHLTI